MAIKDDFKRMIRSKCLKKKKQLLVIYPNNNYNYYCYYDDEDDDDDELRGCVAVLVVQSLLGDLSACLVRFVFREAKHQYNL